MSENQHLDGPDLSQGVARDQFTLLVLRYGVS